MTKNKPLCDKYDLSSVTGIFTGAAPLGKETAEDMVKQYPNWKIRQGFGSSSALPSSLSPSHPPPTSLLPQITHSC